MKVTEARLAPRDRAGARPERVRRCSTRVTPAGPVAVRGKAVSTLDIYTPFGRVVGIAMQGVRRG